MKVLVSGCTETVREWHAKRPDRIGALLTPHTGNEPPPEPMEWAADNACFGGLDAPAFLRFLARLVESPRKPSWVCCPDVVADMGATLDLYDRWAPCMRSLGLPVALVLQDGAERLKWRGRFPWMFASEIAAVFVGGSTQWKESEHAEMLAKQAKDSGLLVHVGRVNTERRIHRIAKWGCVDTFDGSGWSRWGSKRIPLAVKWIDSALFHSRQPTLW
jgi:hypothetical protein